MAGLDEAARAAFIEKHGEWAMQGESISRTFIHRDFNESMGFVNRVALAAEVANHHPDIDIRWNKVKLVLSTHEQGALTEQDTALAAQIDGF